MKLDPIGVVHSCFGSKFGVPRQPGLCPSAWGHVLLHPPFRSPEAVRGLEGFSHVWLIFAFHETVSQGWRPTVRPPRLGGNQRVGVFASRSTFRPNGLGLSLVRLEAVDYDDPQGPVLRLGGLDLLDGTPVFDIKPYLPYAEAIPDAQAGFADSPIPRLEVCIEPSADEDFSALPPRAQALIREALALDPRPATSPAAPDHVFGALLCGKNVRFVVDALACRIVSIEDGLAPLTRKAVG